MKYVLAIDQGTTSTRAIIFNESLVPIASAQEEFTQFYPQSGWVEHDPQDLWGTTASTCRGAIERANIVATNITSIGITNQRETTLVWNRKTGQPIYNAIVCRIAGLLIIAKIYAMKATAICLPIALAC